MSATLPQPVTAAQRVVALEYLRHPTPGALRKLRAIVPPQDVLALEQIARQGYHTDSVISVRYGLALGDADQWSYRAARPEDLRPGTRFEYCDTGNQIVLIREMESPGVWEVARISQRTGEAHSFDWARGDMLIASVAFALVVEGLPLIWDPRVERASREQAEGCIAEAAAQEDAPCGEQEAQM